MNRYNIIDKLGDGAFGVVHKAEQKSTGETVAIKVMKQRFTTWEECLQLREIISLRRLQHANIIKLKEVVRENTELCMVFEYMEHNIYQLMKDRAAARHGSPNVFDEKEIRSILTQTLLGLQAIHKGGFMHRDLKPENLLTKGDLVKIADFGLAKEIRSRPPFTDYVSTRWYRAPEIVLRSDRYNSPIDIWALGVITIELFLNRPLFPGASDTDQLFKICSVLGAPTTAEWDEGHQLARRMNLRFPSISPTPLRQLLSNTCASPAALDLLENMLRFNPSDRPTATQCLQHPFITGQDSHSSAPGPYGGSSFGGTATSNLFMGIASGATHNPFHLAVGVPGGAGPSSTSSSGTGMPNSYGGYHGAGGPVGSSGSTTQPGGYQRQSPSPGGSPTPGNYGTGQYHAGGGGSSNAGGGYSYNQQQQGGQNQQQQGGQNRFASTGYSAQGGGYSGGGGQYGGGGNTTNSSGHPVSPVQYGAQHGTNFRPSQPQQQSYSGGGSYGGNAFNSGGAGSYGQHARTSSDPSGGGHQSHGYQPHHATQPSPLDEY